MVRKEGSPVWKWPLIIVIVIVALVASGAMLHAMGLIDVGEWILARLEQSSTFQTHASIYRLGLQSEETVKQVRAHVEIQEAELEEERAALAAERELLQQEWNTLEKERAALEQRARQLDAMQENLEARAARLDDFERLQVLYNGMRADDLIPILAELEDGTVARLLVGMDDRKVAQVLTAMEPTRAAALSRMIGGVSAK